MGPNVKSSSARAIGENVRLSFSFPITESDEWQWGATMTIAQIDAHIEQCKAARDVAATIQSKSGQSADASLRR